MGVFRLVGPSECEFEDTNEKQQVNTSAGNPGLPELQGLRSSQTTGKGQAWPPVLDIQERAMAEDRP